MSIASQLSKNRCDLRLNRTHFWTHNRNITRYNFADDSKYTPRVRAAEQPPTYSLPDLIRHWEIPILQPPVRERNGLQRIGKTHKDKNPKRCPGVVNRGNT